MSFRTDRKRATGLGRAGGAAREWWVTRVESALLVPLGLLFIFPFARALGQGPVVVREVYGHWFNAIIAVLFLGIAFHHLMLGVKSVIDDYVHHQGWRVGLLIGNALFCGLAAVAGIFAVLKIALG